MDNNNRFEKLKVQVQWETSIFRGLAMVSSLTLAAGAISMPLGIEHIVSISTSHLALAGVVGTVLFTGTVFASWDHVSRVSAIDSLDSLKNLKENFNKDIAQWRSAAIGTALLASVAMYSIYNNIEHIHVESIHTSALTISGTLATVFFSGAALASWNHVQSTVADVKEKLNKDIAQWSSLAIGSALTAGVGLCLKYNNIEYIHDVSIPTIAFFLAGAIATTFFTGGTIASMVSERLANKTLKSIDSSQT